MSKSPIPATGEAVPAPMKMNRRTALLSIASVSSAGAAGAFAATAATQPGIEEPVDRVRRLSDELAQALDDFCDGRVFVNVYPSKRGTPPRILEITSWLCVGEMNSVGMDLEA